MPENGRGESAGSVAKKVILYGAWALGAGLVVKKLTRQETPADHIRAVAHGLSGVKFSSEQAARDPSSYFNLRVSTCQAAAMENDAQLLYGEQSFWKTPDKPYRQRFYIVRAAKQDMGASDVEVAFHAVKNPGAYANFCELPKNQRPSPEECILDVGEHLSTVYMAKCAKGRGCLYEGSTPPGGYPNSWGGATRCMSEMAVLKGGGLDTWDRAYDAQDKQVWGPRNGPYEFRAKR